MTTRTLLATLALISALSTHAIPSYSAPRFGCSEEIGTDEPSVGRYILATRTANATVGPGQCLISSNTTYMVWNQPSDGNFVVYKTNGGALSLSWDHAVVGPAKTIIVQNDGHFVAYPNTAVTKRDGSYHGDKQFAIRPTPKDAQSIDNYFLIMQDNGVLGLYRGPNPAQNTGRIWQSHNPGFADYCLVLLSAIGEPLKRIDIKSDSPVLAYGHGTPEKEAWNRQLPPRSTAAAKFMMSPGTCK